MEQTTGSGPADANASDPARAEPAADDLTGPRVWRAGTLVYTSSGLAALFCWPCEVAWTVSPFHPEIQHIPTEVMPYGCHPLRES